MEAQTSHDIDITDFTILYTVQQHEKPLWKNKIHGWIIDNADRLPLTDGVSVQTVGRRVDDLVDDTLLETVIVSPDEIKRDLIIAFRLTEDGQSAIRSYRETLLRQTVCHHVFDESVDHTVDVTALITLMAHKFGWDETVRRDLAARYTAAELAAFLVTAYIDDRVTARFDDDTRKLRDLLTRYNDMADTLQHHEDDPFSR
jgi:hypothetical protein